MTLPFKEFKMLPVKLSKGDHVETLDSYGRRRGKYIVNSVENRTAKIRPLRWYDKLLVWVVRLKRSLKV